MEERLAYLTDQLSDAIEDLEKALGIDDSALDPVVADTVRSGRAQKFEFTVELFWKTAKRVPGAPWRNSVVRGILRESRLRAPGKSVTRMLEAADIPKKLSSYFMDKADVRLVLLYGSAAKERFTAKSDIDIAVAGLGRNIDLIDLHQAEGLILHRVMTEGMRIKTDPALFVNSKERRSGITRTSSRCRT